MNAKPPFFIKCKKGAFKMQGELILEAAVCFFCCLGFMWMLVEIVFLLFRPKYKRAILIVEGDEKSTPETVASDAHKIIYAMKVQKCGEIIILSNEGREMTDKLCKYYKNLSCAKNEEIIDIMREKL